MSGHFPRLTLVLLLIGGLTFPARAGDPESPAGRGRPNILLITADDLGTQLGCYGDPLARTPHLDALAAGGVRFTNGYVTQASCSPSRASLLTGLYPHQNGHLGLTNYGYRMRDGVPTLPALLKKAGYRTGIIGKLHVAPEDAFPFDFADVKAQKTWDVAWVARTAQAFVKEAGDRPFFLYVNYFDPHKPFHRQVEGVPADPHAPAQMRPFPFHPVEQLTEAVREDMAGYYNGVARLDAGVGLLLDALRQSGHADDTLVVFVGDHGPPFPRGKNSCYEAGLKVPFLVRWLGASRPHRDDRLVSTIDLLPTALDAAGVAAPAGLPGASLRPLMGGGAAARRRDVLGAENNAHGSQDWFPQRAVRGPRYKLIHTLLPQRPNPKPTADGGRPWLDLMQTAPDASLGGRVFARHRKPPEWELYDLEEDPWELHDLAGKPELAEVEEDLRERLVAWQRDTADPLLDPARLAAQTRTHDEKKGQTPGKRNADKGGE